MKQVFAAGAMTARTGKQAWLLCPRAIALPDRATSHQGLPARQRGMIRALRDEERDEPMQQRYERPMGATDNSKPASSRRSDPMAGIVWMVSACIFFSLFTAITRLIANAGVHPFQSMFLRLVAAMIFLSPLYLMRGRDIVRSANIRLYGMRCAISLVSMAAWFYAVTLMPIAELTAISFLAPIFATVGAVLILGETVRIRRWTATAFGFLGALVIIQPGAAAIGPGTIVALISAMLAGLNSILVKQLTNQDDPDRVVFLTFAIMTPFAALPALWVWKPIGWQVWTLVVALGLVGTIGHLMIVRAFAATDASLVMTFDFSRLPLTALLAWGLFGEVTTVWTWVGAGMIFAAGLYTMHREALVKGKRRR
jgi:drug/metabolite transporter (DMT)-like permease